MLLILAVVLLLVLPSPWDLVGFVIAAVLGICELFLWNRTVKHRRHVVGAQTLIGKDAVVVAACQPYGQVRLDGEIWAAYCEEGAGEGDSVRIVGRRQLTLVASRVETGVRAGGGSPAPDQPVSPDGSP
jgi:membrane protein implicated in regulation of membrane protease activity